MRLVPILVGISLISCKGSDSLVKASSDLVFVELFNKDSISISVEAVDLSEDMSIVSSKNDEILIMIYEIQDSANLEKALFIQKSVFDSNRRLQEFGIALPHQIEADSLLIFLIEQDSETPIEQIEPIVRIQFEEIINAHQSRDYIALEKYLGDEDLLGFKKVPTSSVGSIAIRFRGVQKLDKYDYKVIVNGD